MVETLTILVVLRYSVRRIGNYDLQSGSKI